MDVLEIAIKGEITNATQANVEKALADNPNAKEIHLDIDSAGGSVFAGYAIYNALVNTGKPVKAFLSNMCGSIATLIATAAKKEDITANKVGHYMIHNPSTEAKGEAKDLENAKEFLDSVKAIMVKRYSEITGLSEKVISDMMDKETNMSMEEAAEKGFIGEAVDSKFKAVAKISHKEIMALTKKEKSAIEELKEMFGSFMERFKPTVKNLAVPLQDGAVIFTNSQSDMVAVGDLAFIDEVMETPAEAGEYVLATGQTVVIGEAGEIVEIKEQEQVMAQLDDTKLKEFEAKLKEAEEKTKQLEEVKSKFEAAEAKAKQMQAELEKYQTPPIKADMHFDEGKHYLDDVALNIKRTFNAQ